MTTASVNPARAGMILWHTRGMGTQASKPRASGDDPAESSSNPNRFP